jgi:hypothetical protein
LARLVYARTLLQLKGRALQQAQMEAYRARQLCDDENTLEAIDQFRKSFNLDNSFKHVPDSRNGAIITVPVPYTYKGFIPAPKFPKNFTTILPNDILF